MDSKRILCLQFVLSLVAFKSVFGSVGFSAFNASISLGNNKTLNLNWTSNPGGPSSFNVDALCNNMTVHLLSNVTGSKEHTSIHLASGNPLSSGQVVLLLLHSRLSLMK
ncbi:hypothetical protein C0992_005683 [Termitomyces sp. T32_za158]|nr:hypothetical protein C0992_005683 [Termitomyces sp. T32_za158]